MSKLKNQTKFYENTMQTLDLDFKDSNSLITSLCIEYIGELFCSYKIDFPDIIYILNQNENFTLL